MVHNHHKVDKNNALQHPYDKVFKQLMSHSLIAREMFEAYLPQSVVTDFDFDTLQLCKSSYIDNHLKKSAADIVYQVKTHTKGTGYLYCLCEHQSTPDKNMALRLLNYTCRIMEDHVKQGHVKLPIVIPLLIYHGKKSPYLYSINLFDHFENKAWAEYIPDFHCI